MTLKKRALIRLAPRSLEHQPNLTYGVQQIPLASPRILVLQAEFEILQDETVLAIIYFQYDMPNLPRVVEATARTAMKRAGEVVTAVVAASVSRTDAGAKRLS